MSVAACSGRARRDRRAPRRGRARERGTAAGRGVELEAPDARARVRLKRRRATFRPVLVAISGGAGFLGLHLSRRLLADGHDVRTLDLGRSTTRARGSRRAARRRAARRRTPAARRGSRRARACGRRAPDPGVSARSARSTSRARRDARARRSRPASGGRSDLVDGRLRRPRAAPDPRGRSARRRRALRGVEDRGGAAVRDFGRRGLETVIVRRRRSSGRSGSASSRSSSTGSARAAGSRFSATGRTATSCSPSRISSTRSCAASTRRSQARRSTSARPLRHGTRRPRGAHRARRLGLAAAPVPARPAELALRGLELARLSPLAEWHYRTAHKDSFVSIDRARGSRLGADAVERGDTVRDLRLVPRAPRRARRRRDDPPRAVGSARARAPEAPELTVAKGHLTAIGARHRCLSRPRVPIRAGRSTGLYAAACASSSTTAPSSRSSSTRRT